MEIKEIGSFIKIARKSKKLTQQELAENLCITPQAVSRWEKGESLPDTLLLLDLANILGVSVDQILNAGYKSSNKKAKFNVLDVPLGFKNIKEIKEYFGEDSLFYLGMIHGISELMNFDFEKLLAENINILYKEVIIQALNRGYYIEKEEVELLFKDNYKTYNFLMSYDTDYHKEIYGINLKRFYELRKDYK